MPEQRDRVARSEALRARGVERYVAGDLRAALLLWREALGLTPSDVQLAAYVAWAEARLGEEDPAAAAAAFSAAPEVDPWVQTTYTGDEDDDPMPLLPAHPGPAGELAAWTGAAAEPHTPPPSPSPSPFSGVEAPVRRFLAQAPTRPNLVPLDLPELTDERLAHLAGLPEEEPAGSRSPPPLPARAAAAPVPQVRAATPPPRAPVAASPAPPPAATQEPEAQDIAVGGSSAASDQPSGAAGAAEDEAEADGGGHDVSTRKTISPFAEGMKAMKRAVETGNVDMALQIAEDVATFVANVKKPMAEEQQAALVAVYEQALGDRARFVRLGQLPPDLDPRSAFLLSRVDGSFTIDDLLDISGMDRGDASRLVALLLRSGALVAE